MKEYGKINQVSFSNENKFQIIQNCRLKYLTLKKNQIQSQKMCKDLKQQLLKMGAQTNSLLISVSSLSSCSLELKSQIPQKIKQLSSSKDQQKRFQYKVQKIQIKSKQLQERIRRFNEMMNVKKQKNQLSKCKILKFQQNIRWQTQRERAFNNEIKQLQSEHENKTLKQSKYSSLNKNDSFNKRQTYNLEDYIELQALNNQSKLKKSKHLKDQINRKNTTIKSSINKIQQKISQTKKYLSESNSIPTMNEVALMQNNMKRKGQNCQSACGKIKASNKSNCKESNDSNDTNNQAFDIELQGEQNCIDFQSCNFTQNIFIKSLRLERTTLKDLQEIYIENLENNTSLMSQLVQANKIFQSEIIRQNNQLYQASTKGKKIIERHKTLVR